MCEYYGIFMYIFDIFFGNTDDVKQLFWKIPLTMEELKEQDIIHKKVLTCSVCDKQMATRATYNRHMKIHNGMYHQRQIFLVAN